MNKSLVGPVVTGLIVAGVALVFRMTAERIETIECLGVRREGDEGMDGTAISLCMENDLPIIVFAFRSEGNIRRAVSGEPIGTLVHGSAPR